MDANYTSLDRVLRLAYEQSATGKGKDRHANSKAFDEQPIIEIARMVGAGFNTGQAMKKLQESMGMHTKGKHEAALAELLGAIVYTAAAYLVVEEAAQNEKDQYKLRIDEPVRGPKWRDGETRIVDTRPQAIGSVATAHSA